MDSDAVLSPSWPGGPRVSWQAEVSQGQKVTYIISGWLSMFSQNLSRVTSLSHPVVKNLLSNAEDMG